MANISPDKWKNLKRDLKLTVGAGAALSAAVALNAPEAVREAGLKGGALALTGVVAGAGVTAGLAYFRRKAKKEREMDERTLEKEPFRSLGNGLSAVASYGRIAEEQKRLKAEADERMDRYEEGTKKYDHWKAVGEIIQDRVDAATELQGESRETVARAQKALEMLPRGQKILLTPEARKSVGWEPLTRQEGKSIRQELRRAK